MAVMPRFLSHRSTLKNLGCLPEVRLHTATFLMLLSINANDLSRALRNLAKEYVFDEITYLR